MRRFLILSLFLILPLFGGLKNLSLKRAIDIVKRKNLEIKIAKYEAVMKKYEAIAAKAYDYGKLDFTLMILRSNDAGNVFGFKLQSREATFRDFGFSDFMNALGQGVMQSALLDPNGRPNFAYFAQGLAQNSDAILNLEPKDLNYPRPRTHFLKKFTYQIPLFTGFKLTYYKKITRAMYQMSKLDIEKVKRAKIYELKKTFYGISTLNNFIYNLRVIKKNILRLKNVISEMKKEGYAKDTDVLEIEAKAAEVESMITEAKLNRELAYAFLSFLLDTKVDSIRPVRGLAKEPRVTKADIERRSIDILKAKLGLKITKMAVKVEKSKFMPMVGAFAEYGSADNSLLGDFRKHDFYTIGVQVKWNLFNGGADKASLEKARVNVLKVATQLKMAKKGIALKVKQLKAQIRTLNAQIRSYKKQLNYARRVYATYKEKYKEGLASSITELLIHQSKEIEVLLKLLKIKNERNEKVFKLESIIKG